MSGALWCLAAVFLAVDAMLALSLFEWWLLREPDENPVLREIIEQGWTAEPLTTEEEDEVVAFFRMVRERGGM